jgi:hypothetical protein
MDLLKDLLLKYGKSANLLNAAGRCNLLKMMVDCMIFRKGGTEIELRGSDAICLVIPERLGKNGWMQLRFRADVDR